MRERNGVYEVVSRKSRLPLAARIPYSLLPTHYSPVYDRLVSHYDPLAGVFTYGYDLAGRRVNM
jgi:hypothetical protein